MIFARLLTANEEIERIEKNVGGSGGYFPSIFSRNSTDADITREYKRRRDVLTALGSLPIEDVAAEIAGFDAQEHIDAAKNKQALVFEMENGEYYVPVWSLDQDTGKTIPLAIEAAQTFVQRHDRKDVISFSRMLATMYVELNTNNVYAETGDQRPIREEFQPRLYKQFLAQAHKKGMSRSWMEAISMSSFDKNAAYISIELLKSMERVIAPGHRPDSYEHVVNSTEPDYAPRAQSAKATAKVQNIIR